ncbi:Hypothetical protein A7982_01436 [Minicystis rosea]|nr:Hypothetical protein A7982_01436 [Minicystis rosea]
MSKSALDLTWIDDVNPARGVFVTVQGLLVYFEQADARRLFTAVVDRFPGVELMFDIIPPWLSKKTLEGFHKTKHYRAPPMPRGVRRARAWRGWLGAAVVLANTSAAKPPTCHRTRDDDRSEGMRPFPGVCIVRPASLGKPHWGCFVIDPR